MTKISIRKLQKSYTDRKKKSVVALYDCSLDVEQGEFLVLLGESGCGKTSLLKVIGGIEPYDFGDIFFDGIPADEMTQREKNMSYVSQNIVLFPHRTVYENIMEPLDILRYPKEEKIKRVKELSRLLGLDLFLTRKPRELSGGQQQRVAIARALAKEPAICLFDEPLSALDPIYHDDLIELLKNIHNQTKSTFVYSTHNQDEAVRLADRIVIMHNLRVEQIGRPIEFFEKPKTTFIVDFLKNIFLLRLPFKLVGGCFCNEQINLHKKAALAPGILKKIEGKECSVAFRSKNILISPDGLISVKVISRALNSVVVSLLDKEFKLQCEDGFELDDNLRIDLNFEGASIFVDGENILL